MNQFSYMSEARNTDLTDYLPQQEWIVNFAYVLHYDDLGYGKKGIALANGGEIRAMLPSQVGCSIQLCLLGNKTLIHRWENDVPWNGLTPGL